MHANAFRHTRLVWAELTKNPNRSVRELMRATSLSYGGVDAALTRLEQLGYIAQYGERARVVLVPFAEQTR